MDRRTFLKNSLFTAAAVGLSSDLLARSESPNPAPSSSADDWGDAFIVDTNVDLFNWPFRRLKYGNTVDLVAKLRRHRVKQAWAGNFESLLHKNLDRDNTRLAEECRQNGNGILVPFGCINPALPDWREDLRRCHEDYRMRGLKLFPSYHVYTLDRPDFKELIKRATDWGMLVQIAICMEDQRMQYPLVPVPAVDVSPLPAILKEIPEARVMLVNAFTDIFRERDLTPLIKETKVAFEFSDLDGPGAVGEVLNGGHRILSTGAKFPLERLTLGSHAPLFPLENALFKLIEARLSREQIEALAFRNADRLLAA